MKYLLSKFDPGLKQLENKVGVASIRLNPSCQVLTLFASENGFDEVSALIDDCCEYLESALPAEEQHQHHHDEIECCVCFTIVKSPGDIFRLEYCGHVYCRECMSLQVALSALSFPVECAADQCSKPFVWKDFLNLSRRIVGFDLRSFVANSLRSHAATNPNLVRYCPTPDCPIVYTVSHDNVMGERFFCANCGASTCTKCHDTFHERITCEENKASKEGCKELDEWMQKNKKSRKRCPKCNIPIEKNEGCNHIHCHQCSADICWVCLKYFDTDEDCYHHMHDHHRGLWD
jgi:ATP-dependent RNA helicase DHX8/PRP22